MEKREILNKLLSILTKFLQINADFGKDYEQDRRLFRGLCNKSLSLDGIDKDFYELQDNLLKIELEEKKVVDASEFDFKGNICLWQGDITRLKIDAIVNAANSDFLGCFYPCHACIDNIIMSSSGFQMRNELLMLKQQKDYDMQKVKVSGAYNLPSKYVFHVAGPQVFARVSRKDEQDLKNCYLACLDKAKEMNLHSIAFCCISTGVYSFPNELASKIAIKAVKDWLAKENFDIKIVFNVFKDIDEEIYERGLQEEN
jgi:O-acetyl-ADP-ribose deacetylase (regulator of RNase III)